MSENILPEIHSSADAAKIPWQDAVVWVTNAEGKQIFNWIMGEDIQYLTWTNGNISINPHYSSPLANYFQSLILQGVITFVGKNVNVG